MTKVSDLSPHVSVLCWGLEVALLAQGNPVTSRLKLQARATVATWLGTSWLQTRENFASMATMAGWLGTSWLGLALRGNLIIISQEWSASHWGWLEIDRKEGRVKWAPLHQGKLGLMVGFPSMRLEIHPVWMEFQPLDGNPSSGWIFHRGLVGFPTICPKMGGWKSNHPWVKARPENCKSFVIPPYKIVQEKMQEKLLCCFQAYPDSWPPTPHPTWLSGFCAF